MYDSGDSKDNSDDIWDDLYNREDDSYYSDG